jgi:ABC-type nitrate/sulfonate/bicarbonate transport system ATPase subunit
MIICKDICKNYNEKIVLKNVNIAFKKGNVSCILVHSGVGKTTLLNAIAGLDNYNGEIIGIDGKISYAFQTPCLVENMSVINNILFINNSVDKLEIENCLEKLEMKCLINSLCKNLSVGEKQRVNFLRALLYFPKLLILDETFSSLDVKSKLLCEKLLLEYKNKCNSANYHKHCGQL